MDGVTVYRPAVRVLCLDADNRILLLHWRDPFDGSSLWEPPGGGIEPGETPIGAARRELVEETGLDPAAIGERSVDVQRDTRWNGKRYVGPEPFFVARFDTHRPAVRRAGLMADEQVNLRGYAWLPWTALAALDDPVQPPELLGVLAVLAPDGPWPPSGAPWR